MPIAVLLTYCPQPLESILLTPTPPAIPLNASCYPVILTLPFVALPTGLQEYRSLTLLFAMTTSFFK